MAAWRRRLPLGEVLAGRPKGRTIKALREQVSRLSSKPQTRDDANRLRCYLDSVLLAQQLRPEKVGGLPEPEVQIILSNLEPLKVAFPLEVKLGLVDRRAADFSQRSDFAQLLDVLKPWAPADTPFSPTVPTLGTVREFPLASRLARFKEQFWSKTVTPFLMTVASDCLPRLATECENIERAFSSEDILELDMAAASLLQDVIASCETLRSLSLRLVDDRSVERVVALNARRGKVDKSIITSTAHAVFGNPVLAETVSWYTKGQPTLAELGNKIDAHLTELQDTSITKPTGDNFKKISSMLKILCTIRSSPAYPLFERFAERLLAATVDIWKAACVVFDGPTKATVTPELAKEMDCFVAEAGLAFSLEAAVADMQPKMGEFTTRLSSEARTTALKNLVSGGWKPSLSDNNFAKTAETFSSALASHAGVGIPTEVASALEDIIVDLAGEVSSHLQAGGESTAMSAALCVWAQYIEVGTPVKATPQLYELCSSTCESVKLTRKAKDSPRDDVKTTRSNLHAMSVATLKLSEAVAVVQKGKESWPLKATITQDVDAILTGTKATFRELVRELADRAEFQVAQALVSCEGLCKSLHEGTPWHDGITGTTPKDWQKYLERSQDTILKLDTKGLEAELQTLSNHLAEFASALDIDDDTAARKKESMTNAQGAHQKMSLLLRCALLTWTLQSGDLDHETMRKRVQADVRRVRGLGVKEKDVLPAPLFKRAWDALSCNL